MTKKRSFFERLTGSVRLDDDLDADDIFVPEKRPETHLSKLGTKSTPKEDWTEAEEEEGELTVDVYQTTNDIYVETMTAGVRPEDLHITITRDMITIRGKREQSKSINDEDFFTRELYWGAFSRTISLPAEVEPEEAEAIEKHGLLVIKLPKINKDKQTQLKVKSSS